MEQIAQTVNQVMTMMKKPCGLTDSYKCNKCKDTGYVSVLKGIYEYGVECDCGKIAKEKRERKLKFANLPETFKDVKLVNFKTDIYRTPVSKSIMAKNITFINEYIDNFNDYFDNGKGLYISSQTKGSGKTRLAASIANALLDKGYEVKFSTSLDIIQEIKNTWINEGKEKISESNLIYYLSTTQVLIIDDFGVENTRDWINEKFYQIINGRYVNNLVTILTSNFTLEKIDYDKRIISRIGERNYKISFPEESVREIYEQNLKNEFTEIISNRG